MKLACEITRKSPTESGAYAVGALVRVTSEAYDLVHSGAVGPGFAREYTGARARIHAGKRSKRFGFVYLLTFPDDPRARYGYGHVPYWWFPHELLTPIVGEVVYL